MEKVLFDPENKLFSSDKEKLKWIESELRYSGGYSPAWCKYLEGEVAKLKSIIQPPRNLVL